MRKYLLLLTLAMVTMIVQAQQPWKAVRENPSPASVSKAAATPHGVITPTASQLWWGYVSDSDIDDLQYRYSGNLGFGSAVTLNNAIMVEASNPFISTSTIKAIRFWLGDDISAINSDITIWISKSLPVSADRADYIQTIEKSDIQSRLNEVVLSTPYDATTLESSEKLYIGFSFSISEMSYPVMSIGKDAAGGFFYDYGNGWIDFCGEGYGYGCLALQLLLDGGTYPNNCVSIVGNLGQSVVKLGERIDVPFTVTNKGKDPVTSFEIELKDVNGTTEKSTWELGTPIYLNGSMTSDISFASAAQARKSEITITVTQVNGVANTLTASEGSAVGTGSLITVSAIPPVVPVIEEFTGTWCGWCPRGTVYMQKAHEQYGDQVVLIAVHSGDPMEVDEYSSVIDAYGDGYPDAIINRSINCDPSSIPYYLPYRFNQPTQGKIDLAAEWEDQSKTAIRFSTKSTFGYSDNDGQYGVALVLVEDGLSGTTSRWAQSNYYDGRSDSDENMSFWLTAGDPVTGLEYNHVAVAAWNTLDGAELPSTFQANVPIDYSFTGDISSNTIIQDKTKLKAVALLIDRVSGNIVNAAQCAIGDFGASIADIGISDNTVVARFSVDGRQLSAPRKGLNIVKTADGRAMKVLVK